jgi:magnesium chelatase family protein
LLDRLDIQLEVPSLRDSELMSQGDGERSEIVRARIERCRAFQMERQGICNAQLDVQGIHRYCNLEEAGQSLLKQAMAKLNLSARGYHRVLKLARTISDLAVSAEIGEQHVAEAIQYRRFDHMVR